MKALEIPTHPRDGVSLEALELALDRDRIKACLLMPNVSNPLGSTMPDAAKKRLVQMLAERDIPLIEDGVYNALSFSDTPPYAAKAYDRKGLVMLCSSFTKSVAPGFRVGWVAAGRYYEQVRILKFMSSGGMPELLQLAVAEFLENGGYERHLRSMQRTYARLTGLTQSAVAKHFPPGTRATRPSGGFVLWVELPKGCDAVELYEQALQERIGVAPGPDVFSDRPLSQLPASSPARRLGPRASKARWSGSGNLRTRSRPAPRGSVPRISEKSSPSPRRRLGSRRINPLLDPGLRRDDLVRASPGLGTGPPFCLSLHHPANPAERRVGRNYRVTITHFSRSLHGPPLCGPSRRPIEPRRESLIVDPRLHEDDL
jgi:hypothetical protein